MPCRPDGAKPPPAVKLPGWKITISSTMTVSAGTAIFHRTMPVLLSESQFAPRALMKVNSRIARTATTRPRPLSCPFVGWSMSKFLWMNGTELT